MLKLINPWVALAILIALLATAGASARLGYKYAEGKQASNAALIEEAAKAFDTAAAKRISEIKVTNTTRKQVLEREIRIVPDYSKCVNSDAGMRTINDALANRSVSPSDSVVPNVNTPD